MFPPRWRLNPADSEGHGPAGPTVGPRTVGVGSPLTLTAWGRDDLIRRQTDIPYGPPDRPAITMTWVKHQGPGDVTFSEPIIAINEASGKATTTATFHDVGDYIVRSPHMTTRESNMPGMRSAAGPMGLCGFGSRDRAR